MAYKYFDAGSSISGAAASPVAMGRAGRAGWPPWAAGVVLLWGVGGVAGQCSYGLCADCNLASHSGCAYNVSTESCSSCWSFDDYPDDCGYHTGCVYTTEGGVEQCNPVGTTCPGPPPPGPPPPGPPSPSPPSPGPSPPGPPPPGPPPPGPPPPGPPSSSTAGPTTGASCSNFASSCSLCLGVGTCGFTPDSGSNGGPFMRHMLNVVL